MSDLLTSSVLTSLCGSRIVLANLVMVGGRDAEERPMVQRHGGSGSRQTTGGKAADAGSRSPSGTAARAVPVAPTLSLPKAWSDRRD